MPNISPASPDAERHLIGILIRDGLKFPDGLVPSDFSEPLLADVAVAIRTLEDKGETADEFTVINFLRNTKFDRPDAFISALTTDAGHAVFNPSHVSLVRRQSALRRLKDIAARALKLADDAEADPQLIVDFAEGEFKAVHGRGAKPTAGPQRMDFDSLMSADRKNDPNNVIGNRWLCKGGSLLIVGQSGTGKSSLMMQAAVHWSLGRDFFGIKPAKPLRSVILQAENDHLDCGESLQDVVAGAYLDSAEIAQLKDHLAIFRDTISTGTAFTSALRDLIVAHRADIVYIDPLLSFAGIDVSAQEQASRFLRHDLAPILLETGAILVAMHHTGKPKAAADKEGQTVADLAYSGLGSSEFTNYFRECAVLFRCQGEEPIYKFGLTKRRGRAGLKDADGQFKGEIYIRHAAQKGVIRWEYSQSPSQVAQPKADSSPAKGSVRR